MTPGKRNITLKMYLFFTGSSEARSMYIPISGSTFKLKILTVWI